MKARNNNKIEKNTRLNCTRKRQEIERRSNERLKLRRKKANFGAAAGSVLQKVTVGSMPHIKQRRQKS